MFLCIDCATKTPVGARFPGGRCADCYVDLVFTIARQDDVTVSTPWMPL